MAAAVSTPVNTVSRDNLTVLIRNNIMNGSFYLTDGEDDRMETDSPLSKPNLQVVSKKLFQSPLLSPTSQTSSPTSPLTSKRSEEQETDQIRRPRKRKHPNFLLQSSCQKFQRAYVNEYDKDSYSPEVEGGMRKKILVSLFHNREYSLDMSF